MVKYFTRDVKPIVAASRQDAAAFTAGDLLFDWKSFEIPKGGAKVVGVTAIIRSKGDAAPTPNNFGLDLIFGKLGTSLGTSNAVGFLSTPQNDILGSVNIAYNTKQVCGIWRGRGRDNRRNNNGRYRYGR